MQYIYLYIVHGRRHQPASDSSMHIKTTEKDGRVDVVGTNEDRAIKITEPVSQKRSQKRQRLFHCGGRENPCPLQATH